MGKDWEYESWSLMTSEDVQEEAFSHMMMGLGGDSSVDQLYRQVVEAFFAGLGGASWGSLRARSAYRIDADASNHSRIIDEQLHFIGR
ncbi:hypothetical protein NS319_03595 [Sphingomonas sanguinis]|uniref:Uncharacterized protein n=2 Tax=Sphingomonas sanguinis TaxID=33051 RepID=A0A147I4E0_9SPHN|nr:hypothetical protein NS319_03595 [Sphingomonas sanguinis]